MEISHRITIAVLLILQTKYSGIFYAVARAKRTTLEKNENLSKNHENLKSNYRGMANLRNGVLPISTLNQLRNALLVHPFKTWSLRRKFATMKDVHIDEDSLRAVIKNGWNERLKQKLDKVLRGETVYLDAFGGSNTAGGGVQGDEGGIEGIYPKVITDWWGKTITPITESHLKVHQIAIGGTASDFFQYCFRSYTHEQLDLVFLEMAVNDLKHFPFQENSSLPLEQLTRQLLTYPTEPALVYVNFFHGGTCKQGCVNLEDYGLSALYDIYNITSLNWRDAVCPTNGFQETGCELVSKDGHHINQLGHAQISLMIINLFRTILRKSLLEIIKNARVALSREIKTSRGMNIWNEYSSRDAQFPRGISRQSIALPSPVFIKKMSDLVTSPLCWTSLTPNYKENVINNTLKLYTLKNEGFYELPYNVLGSKCDSPHYCRVDAYGGWTAQAVGSKLVLSFTVPTRGFVKGSNSRSVLFSTRTCWPCGAAVVRLDDDHHKRYVKTKSKYAETLVLTLASRVKPGEHTLSVEVVETGEVTIVAVMLGPPDGSQSL